MSIILVGEYHDDPNGYVRAKKFIETFKPDVITVESTANKWNEHLTASLLQDYLRTHPIELEEVLFEGLSDGYVEETYRELLLGHIGTSYALINSGIPVLPIDFFPKNKQGNLHYVDSPSIAEMPLDELLQKTADNYASQPSTFEEREFLALPERDEYAQKHIRLQHVRKNVVLHFGGINHTHGEYVNLSSLLSDLSPQVYRLDEL